MTSVSSAGSGRSISDSPPARPASRTARLVRLLEPGTSATQRSGTRPGLTMTRSKAAVRLVNASVGAPGALAGRRHGVPLRAERAHALSLGVAGLAVPAEVVDRVAVVGDLGPPVAALARPQQRLPDRAG